MTMNKEKIIKLVQIISKESYDAGFIGSHVAGSKESWNKLEAELNFKLAMPKIFKEWDDDQHEICSCVDDEIDNLTELYVYRSPGNNTELEFLQWINEGWTEKPNRFAKCIDAIRFNYEVEK